jgi:uncharacterized protein YcfJ
MSLAESVGHYIDSDERAHYGMFPAQENFLGAEFLLRGDSYWLRLSYQSDGERIIEQSPLSEAQFLAFREAVLIIDRGRSADTVKLSDTDRRDGRLRMVTDVFLYGLWLYGPATISLFDIDSNRGASTIELLAGGGAFAGALWKTQDYQLGYARTTLVRWGAYTGTFYGIGLPVLFEAGKDQTYAVGAMAITPIGAYLAHQWGQHRRFAKGEADLITTGVWAGALYGLALPYLLGVDADQGRLRLYLGTSMAGAPLGALITESLFRQRRVNRGRAHLVTLGAIMGFFEGLSIVDLSSDDAPARRYARAAALGAAVGAWLGFRMTEGRHHSLGRARMISVGAYAGGLAGQGVVMSMGLNGRARTLAWMTGSVLGLWYTDRLTQDWSEGQGLQLQGPSPFALLALGAIRAGGTAAKEPSTFELLRVSF